MRFVYGLACAGLLAGCFGAPQASNQAIVSAITADEVRQVVLSNRSTIWKDPASIREAKIGLPYSCGGGIYYTGNNAPNACVCVEANARNSFGGYNGLQTTEILLNDRRVVDAITPPRNGAPCGALEPLPQLNGDYAPAAAPQRTKRQS